MRDEIKIVEHFLKNDPKQREADLRVAAALKVFSFYKGFGHNRHFQPIKATPNEIDDTLYEIEKKL